MTPGRAIVTGAADRLGRSMAAALAEDGWDVAIHYNSSSGEAEETAGLVRAAGQASAVLPADLLDDAAAEALVGQAAGALDGPLSLLINNASIFEDDRATTLTPGSWERAMGSNLRAPMLLTAAFARQAPAAGRDSRGEPVARAAVINMIDQRVWKPTPFFLSYSVAKAGLLQFTRLAAQGLAPAIRVNGIGPGPTIVAERQSEEHFARQRAACVLGRGPNPEDIVGALRYLLSADAVTGQMIAVDGGQHLAWQTPDVQGPQA